jgi:DNA-binding GntR family transcriptional regulator
MKAVHQRRSTAMIKIEFAVMNSLAGQQLTPAELCEALPFGRNQVKYTIQNLRSSGCIKRIPKSHKMILVDI